MNPETDRVPVPTNGRGPHPHAPTIPADDVPAGAVAGNGPAGPAATDGGAPPATEPIIAFTPTQLAVGFGILASLIVLLVRSRRRRGG